MSLVRQILVLWVLLLGAAFAWSAPESAPSVPDAEAAAGSRNYYEELFGDAPSLTPATKSPAGGRIEMAGAKPSGIFVDAASDPS